MVKYIFLTLWINGLFIFRKVGNQSMKKRILLLLSFVLLFIISCGKNPAVKDFEESMKVIQSGKFVNEVQTGLDEKTLAAISSAGKKITYKVNKTDVQKDTVTINVTMKSPDLSDITSKLVQELSSLKPDQLLGKSEEELKKIGSEATEKLITQELNSGNLKYMEKTFDVIYKKNGNKWDLDPMANIEFLNMTSYGMMNLGK